MNHVFWYVLSHGEFRVLYVAEFEFVCSSEVEIWEMMMESVEGFLFHGKDHFLWEVNFFGVLWFAWLERDRRTFAGVDKLWHNIWEFDIFQPFLWLLIQISFITVLYF